MEHFPPLDSKPNQLSKHPKIIGRGSLTIATPINEVKFFRNTSDLIGNNYSPQAKDLNVKSINEFSKSSKIIFRKKSQKSNFYFIRFRRRYIFIRHQKQSIRCSIKQLESKRFGYILLRLMGLHK